MVLQAVQVLVAFAANVASIGLMFLHSDRARVRV